MALVVQEGCAIISEMEGERTAWDAELDNLKEGASHPRGRWTELSWQLFWTKLGRILENARLAQEAQAVKRVLRTRSNTVGKHLLVYHRRRRRRRVERDEDAAIAQELVALRRRDTPTMPRRGPAIAPARRELIGGPGTFVGDAQKHHKHFAHHQRHQYYWRI